MAEITVYNYVVSPDNFPNGVGVAGVDKAIADEAAVTVKHLGSWTKHQNGNLYLYVEFADDLEVQDPDQYGPR